MDRVPSQIRRDYKSVSLNKATRPHLKWFAIGLVIPVTLSVVLTMSGESDDREQPVSSDKLGDGSALTTALALPGPVTTLYATDIRAAAPVTEAEPRADDHAKNSPPGAESVTLTVRNGDTLDGLFGKNDLSRADLLAIVALEDAKSAFAVIKPGDQFEVAHIDGRVHSISRRVDETRSIVVSKQDSTYVVTPIDHPTESLIAYRHGVIESSLFEAGKKANVSDKLIMNLAGIFAWDVDFVLDIRQGDRFIVVYEEIWQDGEMIRDGDILAAEFVNDGDTFRAIRYVDSESNADYFNPKGRSVRKAFIRAPVDFSRISSSFNPKRRHPVLNVVRAHKGVDYAAPSGTPIKAAGDGKIIHRGKKGGYGNAVIVQHGGNITTLYAHMSRFANKTGVGTRVRQGQVIGYVGRTGLATAPHLHYEYRLNGVHRNPRTVPLPDTDPIAETERDAFQAQADLMLAQLDTLKRTQIAAVAAP